MSNNCSEQWRQRLEDYLKNRATKGPFDNGWISQADHSIIIGHVAQCEACQSRYYEGIAAIRQQTQKPSIAKLDTTRNFRSSLFGPLGFSDCL